MEPPQEINGLQALSYACGSAEIMVTDAAGNSDTEHVRSTNGEWVFKGTQCGLKGSVSCYHYDIYFGTAYYELIQGNQKQWQATKIVKAHGIHPNQGHCQWCEDWYQGKPYGSIPNTVDWPNCIDGDHEVPGLTSCCSTNDYWCDMDDCRSSVWACDEGDDHWMAHGEAACIWDRGGQYGVQLKYYEWECPQ